MNESEAKEVAVDGEWARGLVTRGAVVLHRPSLVVGTAVRFYSGEGEDLWVSPLTRELVREPVLELDNRRAFRAEASETDFRVLTPVQTKFFVTLVSAIAATLREAARLAPAMSVEADLGPDLITAAMQLQAQALVDETHRAVVPATTLTPKPPSVLP